MTAAAIIFQNLSKTIQAENAASTRSCEEQAYKLRTNILYACPLRLISVRSDWKEKEKSQQNNYHKKTKCLFTDQGTMVDHDSGRDMSTGHDMMRGHDTPRHEASVPPEQRAAGQADPQQGRT